MPDHGAASCYRIGNGICQCIDINLSNQLEFQEIDSTINLMSNKFNQIVGEFSFRTIELLACPLDLADFLLLNLRLAPIFRHINNGYVASIPFTKFGLLVRTGI